MLNLKLSRVGLLLSQLSTEGQKLTWLLYLLQYLVEGLRYFYGMKFKIEKETGL